jgi:HSP20 family molecular chaperone IbpA
MNHFGRDQRERDFRRFRESDSYDDFDQDEFDTDGSFSHTASNSPIHSSNEHRKEYRPHGRFKGRNRFGEENIRHDSYQDDEFQNDYDPTYEDEYGMRHPYEHGRSGRWSDDIRSEASRETHFGKGPKGYRRSPDRIKDDACEVLSRDFELDASDIEVDYQDRVLILKGHVSSRHDKRRAEALVEDIPGVEDVQNEIKVKKPGVEGWIPGLGNIENEI